MCAARASPAFLRKDGPGYRRLRPQPSERDERGKGRDEAKEPAPPQDGGVAFGTEQVRQLLEIKELVRELSEKTRAAEAEPKPRFPRGAGDLRDSCRAGRQRGAFKEIANKAQSIMEQKGMEAQAVARQLILDRLGDPYPLKLKKFEQNVLLFAGPTGAGKTTTVAKLAGMLKFRENLKVGLINTDTYRIGAMEHIRIFAGIMDIPLVMAYGEDDVAKALKAMADRDVVLIDTAGKSARDGEYQKELGGLIEKTGADEVFLVLSVSTGSKACRELIRNYSFIQDYKLIVTKLDEVEFPGNVLNIAEFSKKRLAFVTVGQNVPEDIRKADTEQLAGSIAGELFPS